MSRWKVHAPAISLVSLLIGGCVGGQRAFQAPSGNVLVLEVISAQQVTPEEAKVSVCFELPSESDWVIGRLHGDVTLSDEDGSTPMGHFELLATSDSPLRRCDRLFFSRPSGFPPGKYSLTIIRLAATIPAEPDWNALQSALAESAPGLLIERLSGQSGLSFGLVAKPPGMTDAEAADLVVGLAEPVLIGPWSIPVEIQS